MTDTHDASTTLDDIINELKLTYDASNGLLDGDSIRNIPNVNTLTNLNKLFSNLKSQLSQIEKSDETVLKKIEATQGGEDETKKRSSEVLEDQDDNDVKKRKLDTTAENDVEEPTGEKERLNLKDDPVPQFNQGLFLVITIPDSGIPNPNMWSLKCYRLRQSQHLGYIPRIITAWKHMEKSI